MRPDTINSIFQFAAAGVIWTNVFKLWRDKVVRGVYWPFSALFAAGSVWSVYFFVSLHQWHSVFGALLLAAANITWLTLAAYYMRRSAA
jgi:hypothetical protein